MGATPDFSLTPTPSRACDPLRSEGFNLPVLDPSLEVRFAQGVKLPAPSLEVVHDARG
jgi:hypothetical protein